MPTNKQKGSYDAAECRYYYTVKVVEYLTAETKIVADASFIYNGWNQRRPNRGKPITELHHRMQKGEFDELRNNPIALKSLKYFALDDDDLMLGRTKRSRDSSQEVNNEAHVPFFKKRKQEHEAIRRAEMHVAEVQLVTTTTNQQQPQPNEELPAEANPGVEGYVAKDNEREQLAEIIDEVECLNILEGNKEEDMSVLTDADQICTDSVHAAIDRYQSSLGSSFVLQSVETGMEQDGETRSILSYDNYSTFKEAFKNAHMELGAGKVFLYKGRDYSTNRFDGRDLLEERKMRQRRLNDCRPEKPSYSHCRTFKEAFKCAHMELGAGKVFLYKGRDYSTNRSDGRDLREESEARTLEICPVRDAFVQQECDSSSLQQEKQLLGVTDVGTSPGESLEETDFSKLPCYDNCGSLLEAFGRAYIKLGSGCYFRYKGKKYSTNRSDYGDSWTLV